MDTLPSHFVLANQISLPISAAQRHTISSSTKVASDLYVMRRWVRSSLLPSTTAAMIAPPAPELISLQQTTLAFVEEADRELSALAEFVQRHAAHQLTLLQLLRVTVPWAPLLRCMRGALRSCLRARAMAEGASSSGVQDTVALSSAFSSVLV
ncbi:hypothetical protein EON64_16485, partial [archaeon]